MSLKDWFLSPSSLAKMGLPELAEVKQQKSLGRSSSNPFAPTHEIPSVDESIDGIGTDVIIHVRDDHSAHRQHGGPKPVLEAVWPSSITPTPPGWAIEALIS
ncbi:MAG: hypothetical protein H6752_11320 [Candidatus Omnitrophica bacterium]|nr:hypothetical protein [Candidatus Omnitrophota bacterium]